MVLEIQIFEKRKKSKEDNQTCKKKIKQNINLQTSKCITKYNLNIESYFLQFFKSTIIYKN